MRLLRRPADKPQVHLPAENGSHNTAAQDLLVIGAHGGAGTSTIAALMRPAWDMGSLGHRLGHGRPPLQTKGRPLVVVTRNTVAAARHATNAVTALTDQAIAIAALVIVADGAGPEPRDATARYSLLEGRVRGVVRVPFIPGLRLVDDVAHLDEVPGRVQDALTTIWELAYSRPGN
ncbi:hypothetical protein [Thermomonospora cellulosilytica]|uniref:Uncharacterized protein n=1 Tax=Thermomonospora cellulosilytica TaxID=1411118 RepID=A0A7W3MVX1_9ACTN|nr:hypothetical protein [Thermomonospora cellulosilytica]MBA9002871.1 hypothetical protein [Thermomonospora cellulosilytica]